MDSNTYTRLLELPNHQFHAKPPHDPKTAIFRSFTILQSPYFNEHKRPNLFAFNGNSYVYVIVGAFTHYVVLHPSPKKDAANAPTVLFDNWIVKFGIPGFINR